MKITNINSFLKWMSLFITQNSKIECSKILLSTNGNIEFLIKYKKQSITIQWGQYISSQKTKMKNIPFYFGFSVYPSKSIVEELLTELIKCLGPILIKFKPYFFYYFPNNKKFTFNNSLIESLFGEWLVVNQTTLDNFVFTRHTLQKELIQLTFTSFNKEIIATLRMASSNIQEGAFSFGKSLLMLDIPKDKEIKSIYNYLYFMLMRASQSQIDIQGSSQSSLNMFQYDKDNVQFIAERDFECLNIFNAIYHSGNSTILLGHSDRECINTFALAPCRLNSLAISRFHEAIPASYYSRMQVSDITDENIIFGLDKDFWEKKAKDIGSITNDFTFLYHSCLSMMIGDSIYSEIEQTRTIQNSPAKVLCCDMELTGNFSLLKNFWKHIVTEIKKEYRQKNDELLTDKSKINLMGYGYEKNLAEIVNILKNCNFKKVNTIIPSFNKSKFTQTFNAHTNLLLADKTTSIVILPLQKEFPGQIHCINSPFGFEGTEKWISQLLEKCNKMDLLNKVLETHQIPYLEKWNRLKQRAQNISIAIISKIEQIDYFINPLSMLGIPLIASLLDMGFNVELFILETQQPIKIISSHIETNAEGILNLNTIEQVVDKRYLQQFFSENKSLHVNLFNEDHLLFEAVKKSKSNLVFSEIFRDTRLFKLGKIPFNCQDFKMGFKGAIRNLEKLLAMNNSNFNKNYHSYLEESS